MSHGLLNWHVESAPILEIMGCSSQASPVESNLHSQEMLVLMNFHNECLAIHH